MCSIKISLIIYLDKKIKIVFKNIVIRVAASVGLSLNDEIIC